MKIVVTGSAGFLGNYITEYLVVHGHQVIGIDNLSRKGSEINAEKQCIHPQVHFVRADISKSEEIKFLLKEEFDWIIDCAAEPSVLAGFGSGSRSLVDNNLTSTINLLEICKDTKAGFILMSTSRVYSIKALSEMQITESETRFEPALMSGFVNEDFSTKPPVSLYGSTKLTSELLAIEYSQMFDFPVWINRCGVIAGPGQFGKIDQGVFSYWIYSWLRKTPLKYIGFGGNGKQVRDVVHPFDICQVINKQIQDRTVEDDPIYNLGGGLTNSMSLLELTNWCKENIDKDDSHLESSSEVRPFDIPIYLTNYAKANKRWNFRPSITMNTILIEIRDHVINNPDFLNRLYSVNKIVQ
jgi:CDP-paratose 2-epimerase